MISLSRHAEGTVVPVRAQPGARRSAILGERNGALRVAVSAAPERGKANEAIQKLLADALGCRPSLIVLVQGETSRDKRFLVSGLELAELERRVEKLIADCAAESSERNSRKAKDRH